VHPNRALNRVPWVARTSWAVLAAYSGVSLNGASSFDSQPRQFGIQNSESVSLFAFAYFTSIAH
jgi:hypothetical protein